MAEKVLFFFSALGVFNALLLAVYLAWPGKNSTLDRPILSMILLLLVVRVGISCFNYFGPVPFDLIKLGLLANMLLGPSCFVLMMRSNTPKKNLINWSLIHFGILGILSLITWVSFDSDFWNLKLRFLLHGVLTTYLTYLGFRYRAAIWQWLNSNGDQDSQLRIAIATYLAVVTICLGFAISLVTSYILGPLCFSLVFYLGAIHLFRVQKRVQQRQSPRPIESSEVSRLKERLTDLMEREKLYRDPDVGLDSLAQRLSINRHRLSQFLNENLNKSFYQYINGYRIQEACNLLREDNPFSIEAIGYEVGFNSRSSFFSAFRKEIGTSPSKFRHQTSSV